MPNLLYFRGGPRDGQILDFRNEVPPPFLVDESTAMYTVRQLQKSNCFTADFEWILFPEQVSDSVNCPV